MKTTISLSDFSFKFAGHGHFGVCYTSPITGNRYNTVTANMPLIDATKNCDNPKKKDLETLKKLFMQFFMSKTMDKINSVLLIITIIWLFIIIINL